MKHQEEMDYLMQEWLSARFALWTAQADILRCAITEGAILNRLNRLGKKLQRNGHVCSMYVRVNGEAPKIHYAFVSDPVTSWENVHRELLTALTPNWASSNLAKIPLTSGGTGETVSTISKTENA